VALLPAVALLLAGCASPAVRTVRLGEWIRSANRSALLGDDLSEYTLRYLRRRDLTTAAGRRPAKLLADLDAQLYPEADRDTLFALSELCYLQGKRCKGNAREEVRLYLSSARYAYACLFDRAPGARLHEFDPRFRLACDFYNRSLAGLFQGGLARYRLLEEGKTRAPLVRGTIEIRAPRESAIELERLGPESLAYHYEAAAFTTQSRRYGIGVPLIAERAAVETTAGERVTLRRRIPQVTAATAFLRFGSRIGVEDPAGAGRTADFQVFNPVESPEIDIAGRKVQLEADLSTPLAFLLEANRDLSGVSGMRAKLKGDVISARRGLYMMQPYRPGKIPVVFVHGLMSEPTTWLRMLNDLMFDPELTDRYQFWAFFYPTSNPIVISAAELRESLRWTREELDPAGRDAALDSMVVVGHSMGGLLTRLMIQRAEVSLVKSWMGVEIEELDISDEEKALLKRVDTFEPLPFVSRVLFLATPHRGAKMAKGMIGRIGDLIAAAPKYVLNSVEGAFEAVGLDEEDLPSGIDNLRSDSLFMKYFNGLPMDPGIPFHSIIGNAKAADTPGGSDGVVTYDSSHLDGAVSEKIVKFGHNVQKHPRAILEVRRILLLHPDGKPEKTTSASGR
jgi:pimeloyl-ACP methyl ester carboxylesterase